MQRRLGAVLLSLVSLCGCAGLGTAQVVAAPSRATPVHNGTDSLVRDTAPQVMSLWPPEQAPGALGLEAEDQPTITIYRPRLPTTGPTTAVIVAPGGAYIFLARGVEGDDVARWWAMQGVTAAVLQYRHAPRYHYPVPLSDAQRAIRLLRAHAAELGVAPDRIGMMGFSAGGHVAAMAATLFDSGEAKNRDLVERQSSRPDFLILGYPVISFEPSVAGENPLGAYAGSGFSLLGTIVSPTVVAHMSVSAERNVTAQTPPTFLYHGTADQLVNVENSVVFYLALRKAGVPTELHTFEKGDHGGGLNLEDPVLGVWPTLLTHWMRGRGLLPPA